MNACSAGVVAALRCDGARRGDRLRQAEAEVDVVDEHLQHGGDDRRAARRAERERRPAAVEDDRRRHARARPLAAVGRVGRARLEVEVGQLVVEQEAAVRHDDAAAADLLDRERVGDDVAPAVGDRQVGGRATLLVAAGLRGGGGAGRHARHPAGPAARCRRSALRAPARSGRTAARAAARRRRRGRRCTRCGRRRRASTPRGSGGASSPRARCAGSARGCSAPRRRSSRRRTAAPCRRRRGRGSRRGSARAGSPGSPRGRPRVISPAATSRSESGASGGCCTVRAMSRAMPPS